MERPDVSVLVVNHNGGELLLKSLASLYGQAGEVCWEAILVDNASADGSVAAVQALFPAVRVMACAENLGFAKANNLALGLSRGRYVLLLNPDVILEAGALAAVVRFMDADPEVGICGPKIVLPDGRLDAPCRRSFKTPATYFYKALGLGRLFPRSRRFARYYLSYLDEDQSTEVDAVIGAFLMVRRETIEQIGPLDERFFMYCEDEDWCFRAKRAGWKVVYYPEAVVTHHKGSSTRKRQARMVYERHKAIFQFHRKNIAPAYPPLVNGLVYLGIAASLVANLLANGLKFRM